MTNTPRPIPAGYEHLIPHLVCERCSEAIEFYKKALGAEEVRRSPGPDGRLMHAEIRIGNSIVFLVDDFPEFCEGKSESALALKGTPVTIHRYVPDCDAAIKRATDAGATVLMPPMDMFWAIATARCAIRTATSGRLRRTSKTSRRTKCRRRCG